MRLRFPSGHLVILCFVREAELNFVVALGEESRLFALRREARPPRGPPELLGALLQTYKLRKPWLVRFIWWY